MEQSGLGTSLDYFLLAMDKVKCFLFNKSVVLIVKTVFEQH